jgi:hypothetical protein
MIVIAAGWGALHPAYGASTILADEYRVKAEYLFRFLAYVEWPENTAVNGETDLVICYRGDAPMTMALQQLEGRQSGNRRTTVREVKGAGELGGCRMVFLSAVGKRELEQFVAGARERHVLTVGDRKGFARSGGIIGFVIRGNNIRFEVNNQAARQAGLQISSHLLKLATAVTERDDR